ncbi:MAG: magnesium-translocating P-type ATPase [Xanthobacteraceae bacterium]
MSATDSPSAACFWTEPSENALTRLATTGAGLRASEAAVRLQQHGHNAVAQASRRRILARIGRRLTDPLVAILMVAGIVSGLTGDLASAAIIFAILAGSIALEAVQEHNAEEAAEALKRSVAVRASVRRDGAVARIPVEDIVPGDIVELAAGDLVPADGIVLASRAAHTNESLLTGEPYPVEKRAGLCSAEYPAEAFNALFSGTAVVSGEATMLVVATGAGTRFGGIAAALQSDRPPTPFERGIHAFGVLILRMTGFLVLFVLLAHLAFHRPVIESFLFAVALAVGLTPELLPMIMTVTLSRGAVRMARRKVVVKRLAAIHDLGGMDVLCTDKTGTLTEARISLIGHPGSDGTERPRVLELAAVNSRLESGIRSPLDDAILDHAKEFSLPDWRRIADVPFDFERRRVSVLVERDGARSLIVKGAPEQIIERSVAVEAVDGSVHPLDPEAKAEITALYDQRLKDGYRCLAVARRDFPRDRDRPQPDDETGLTFVGLCVFADPPKASAAEGIARLSHLGVRVKIISGDAAATVRHLVGTLKIPARGLLTGAELDRMNDAALAAKAQRTDLFARVSPDQKTRIIRALRARGHRVGFIGDGINDAPAIRTADAGLAVDSATDVARAAADLILLAPDLGVVADGVEEGRRTYANIMKYLRMGTSSNFGNMVSMAVASLFIPFLPLTPIQVLLNNLLYDLSETGIPFDRVDKADLAHPHAWRMADLLRFTLIMGPLSSLFDIAIFVLLLVGFGAGPELFRTAWFVESMGTQILVIFLIRTAAPAWTSWPHPALVATSLGALGAAILLAVSPVGTVLGFAPLPWPIILAIAGLVLAYLVAAEYLKRYAVGETERHRRHHGRHRNHAHAGPHGAR